LGKKAKEQRRESRAEQEVKAAFDKIRKGEQSRQEDYQPKPKKEGK
jgi:hypothetical protein